MLVVPCFSCYTAVRVMSAPDKVAELVGALSDYWPDKYVCIVCGKKCEGLPESDVETAVLQRMKVRDLSAEEFLAALEGFGLPEEMLCTGASVREVLQGRPIKLLHGRDLRGTTRFCIDSIELEDGTKIHFGASPMGAVVYRISRPISYTQNVLAENG